MVILQIMKQVKIFNRHWEATDLTEDINSWILKNEEFDIKQIKYRVNEGYHYAMIVYSIGVKL